MVLIPVSCPYCHSDQVIKGGKTDTGKQRYHCQQDNCSHRSFVLDPAYNERLPQVKDQIGLNMGLKEQRVDNGTCYIIRPLRLEPHTEDTFTDCTACVREEDRCSVRFGLLE